jgi:ATP-dependent helicase/nuclease subunit A
MQATEAPTSARQWTEAQKQAISLTGTSLLVSAAAGSGKTSVLAERCVYLLCDADPPCDVADLLVVTFTEAAAAEMKGRIAKSLSDRHAKSPGDFTAKHLAMLDRANISTLHGFCARVLRQNFHLMGLDPEFRILDEDESSLLKLATARELFDERYDDPDDDDFRNMVDSYADGQDDRLIAQVIRAYNTLCSVVDPARWLHQARHRIESAIDLPLDKSVLGQAYMKMIRRQLESILRECADVANAIKKLKHFEQYVQLLREMYTTVKHWISVFDTHGLDALSQESSSVEWPKLKPVSNTIENKEIAKAQLDSVRDSMKNGAWRKNLLFTEEEWKEGLRLTLPHVDVFLSLVADFSDRYTRTKDEDGSVDFADLEQLTLRSLKLEGIDPITAAPLAKTFHHQFKHVLVDEFQDINEVQDAILSLVSRECLAGKTDLESNLFCVGDVKQSIYRFRLAEAGQFLKRREDYSKPQSHGKVIDLQANFRSRAPLLEAINSVFERLMTRAAADLDYDQSQRLTPGQSFIDSENGFKGSPIELHLLPKDVPGSGETENDEVALDRSQREAVLLGHRVLEMLGKKNKPPMMVVDRSGAEPKSRPIRFGDIVLLLRSMRFKADLFAATLRGMGVPVHAESATGYFEATEVNDILSLLHVLDNQRQDIHLAAVLRSPLINLPNPQTSLARIRIAYSGNPPVPFHLAVQKYADEHTDELAEFLCGVRAKLEKWRQEVRQRPVAEMLWSIFNQTGYLAYVTGLPNGRQRQANLIELHDRAQQFGTFHRQGLSRFLDFLEKLKEESDLGQASVASEADDVVRIMSIHRSKGQEFPVVLLPDLGKAINLQDCQGSILLDRAMGLGLQVVDPVLQIRYPSLASTVVSQQLKQQTMAEELRVLYVAMTRAKEHLIMTGTCAETQPDKWKQQWADHVGRIAAEAVLDARTTLDWLGPVAAIIPDQIDVQSHTIDEINAWTTDHSAAMNMTPAQIDMAHLKPLSPAPPVSNDAQAVIARMNQQYAYESVADRAATASVTKLTKNSQSSGEHSLGPTDRDLPQPTFVVGTIPATAADIGTATHAVLENFDFTRDITPDAIQQQINHLVSAHRLKLELANIVNIDAIAWFLEGDIGQLIRQNAADLQREVPVYYATPSETTQDPLDQPMIRGRVDLLVPTQAGWVIVDYKTDRVTGPGIDQRTALYAGQLNEYRKAIRRITGKPVVECALVFLHPREIRKV